jgi:hypothetical protein
MSDGGWEGLPRIEHLPKVEGGGYDPVAVAAAFDAFYRHAADVDATLRVLESVDAFQKQAGDLRADIRALRAASWGPLPAARPTYAPAYTVRAERFGGFDLVPRLAIEAAFIIAVALTAAAAGLAAVWVVLLVAGAWLVVGAAEVVASSARPRLRTPSLGRPSVLRAEPAAADAAAAFGWPESAPAEEPEPAAAPEPEPAEPAAAAEPEQALGTPARRSRWRRAKAEPAAAVEPPAPPRHVRVLPAEPEPIAEPEPELAAAEPEPEPVAEEPAPEPEPEPVAETSQPEPAAAEADSWAKEPAAAADPWEAPPALPEAADTARRGRFRKRRASEAASAPESDGHVEIAEPAALADELEAAPEESQDERPEFPSLTPKPARPGPRSRRGRR